MKCGKCGAETRVLETRQYAPTAIRRRRTCTNTACGARFTTEETVLVAVPTQGTKPAGEVALALIERRRQNQVQARRANEERAMMRDLGLNDEEYDDGR